MRVASASALLAQETSDNWLQPPASRSTAGGLIVRVQYRTMRRPEQSIPRIVSTLERGKPRCPEQIEPGAGLTVPGD